MSELEEALAALRQEWKKRQEQYHSSEGRQSPTAKRVPSEYNEAEDPLEEKIADSAPSASSSGAAPSSQLSRDGRDAERRVILEELRTGSISVEEAEHRLNSLD